MFSFNKPASAGAATGVQSNSLFGQQNNTASTGTNQGTGFSFGQSNPGMSNATSGIPFGGQTQGQGQGQGQGGPTGGLFGNASNTNTTTTGGGSGFSFGQQTNKPVGGSLFGSNANSGANSGGSGLFGSKTNNTGSSSLFGNNNAYAGTNTNTSGGLFGAKTQPTASFGQNNTGAATGGLFGSNLNNSSGNNQLFGDNPASSKRLFGAKPAGTSLFGGSTVGGGSGGSLFGSQQPQFQQQQQQQQQTALQAISQLPITPMTKIIDLPPQLRGEIEQLDQYIQRQVQISQHLKADTSEHKELIVSIPSDVAYLSKTESFANQSLAQDLKKISSLKDVTDQSLADSQTFSMILQQLLTPGSKISSLELDKFFHNRIQLYQSKLDDYFHVLSDIESAVNGIDTDVVGGYPASSELSNGDFPASESLDLFAVKTGLNALVSTVIEEFKLFMDTAERVAELHQKVKELVADSVGTTI